MSQDKSKLLSAAVSRMRECGRRIASKRPGEKELGEMLGAFGAVESMLGLGFLVAVTRGVNPDTDVLKEVKNEVAEALRDLRAARESSKLSSQDFDELTACALRISIKMKSAVKFTPARVAAGF